MTDAFPK